MATPVLNAELRDATGKSKTSELRAEGKVPAVVYSRGANTKEVALDERETLRVLSKFGQNVRMNLNIAGEKGFVIIKDIQRGAVNKKILHMDFQTLDENEKIRMTLPIQLINREDVESSSQFVQLVINEIEIQTYPRYLPDKVELDAAKLKDNGVLTIADLNIDQDENIEISDEKDRVIATLTEVTAMADPETEEGEEAEAVEEVTEESETEE